MDSAYAIALGEINKAKKDKKKWCMIDVPREKSYVLKQILEKKGYEVDIKDVLI